MSRSKRSSSTPSASPISLARGSAAPQRRAERTPALLDVDGLTSALRALGVHVDIDPRAAPRPEFLVLKLAHGLIGAADRHAMLAEAAARSAGVGVDELGRAAGDVYDGAACHTDVEALGLVEWRVTRTIQALQQLQLLDGPAGGPDPLGRTILLTAAALAGLLSAAATLRNPWRRAGDTAAAAHCVRQAIAALDHAARDAKNQRVVVDLLSLAD